MFGKRGLESPKEKEQVVTAEKAARVFSIDNNMVDLVNRYQELQISLISDDAELLTETVNEIREAIKAKNMILNVTTENDADIKAFVDSFVARGQNI